MKRLFLAAAVALMLVVWVGASFARGRDDGRRARRSDDALRRRQHERYEPECRRETARWRKTHTRHRTRVYYFPSDYGHGRVRAYNDESD